MRSPIIDQKILDSIKKARSKKFEVFMKTDDSLKGFVLLALPAQTRRQIVKSLDNSDLAKILTTLDPDKATDILQELPNHRAKHLTESLDGDAKEKVELLLSFNPKTAAGLMNLDYIVTPPGTRFDDLSADIQ